MMVTFHSNIFFSSTSPAENPSTGCLHRSESKKKQNLEIKAIRKRTVRRIDLCVPFSCF